MVVFGNVQFCGGYTRVDSSHPYLPHPHAQLVAQSSIDKTHTMAAGPVDNIILLADCYKSSHYKVYPPGTTKLYAYFESRGGKFPYTVFFGLQYILKQWLCGPVVTRAMVDEAKQIINTVFKRNDVFNEEGWNYLLEHHGGRLPLRVKAVPEGSVVPTRNVLFTVENTDPALPWTLLVQTWYPMTVATNSRVYKQIIHHYMNLTHDNTHTVEYSLHDAGYRGVSSVESAALGGAAHMINFKSSDTVAGTSLLRKYYHLETVAGFSSPSSEHSTVTTWGKTRELEAHRHMLSTYSEGDVGCVCDSYNIWQCLEEHWCEDLRDLVLERGRKGGCIYLRPDSGDPKEVVLKSLEILGKAYGTETNSKGYKLLPPYLRVIHADGINHKALWSILEHLKNHGWSTASAYFGAGAALLQRLDRDTQRCAYKVSFAEVEGEGVEVYKEPVTDSGKTSKRGRLTLQCEDGVYTTVQSGKGDPAKDQLVTVFENGELLRDYTFREVQDRADITFDDFDIIKFLKEDTD
ncbi:Nicotinamide phosphoribosyltransferase-like 2 [Homarus americanus]|uniref:Nicotinamide phosphoribosyltransferase n=1 Tax=Homarus americanus TaxID=6706 RepID=A0A8J5MSS9_HOMAM|nr:Nicotinamide phosphoribosyltransferase-like 2 [Homarus americanus]